MTPDAIGKGTLQRHTRLRICDGPLLSVYPDLDAESLPTPAIRGCARC